jgi:hypothetical protein
MGLVDIADLPFVDNGVLDFLAGAAIGVLLYSFKPAVIA